jgi:hypothetical protein
VISNSWVMPRPHLFLFFAKITCRIMKPIKEKIVSNDSTAGAVVSEVITTVGTVVVSYVVLVTAAKAWKLGKKVVSSKLSKG